MCSIDRLQFNFAQREIERNINFRREFFFLQAALYDDIMFLIDYGLISQREELFENRAIEQRRKE